MSGRAEAAGSVPGASWPSFWKGGARARYLPDVIELVLSRPPVSVPMLVRELTVSRQAATQLIDVVRPHLRELTGRGRYRAWGVV